MRRNDKTGYIVVADGWRALALLAVVTLAALGLALWAGNALVYGPSLPVDPPSVTVTEGELS